MAMDISLYTEAGKYLATMDDTMTLPLGTLVSLPKQKYKLDEYWEYQRYGPTTFVSWEIIAYEVVMQAEMRNRQGSHDTFKTVTSTESFDPDVRAICRPCPDRSHTRIS